MNEPIVLTESRDIGKRQQLSARVYYGLILAGVFTGVIVCCLLGSWYLHAEGSRKPTAIRIWDNLAEDLVEPICAMIGATFGGLLGVAAAVVSNSRMNRLS